MEFGFTFDANEVEPDERQPGDFSPIPANTRVTLQAIEAELVPTKTGQGIKLAFEVIAGQYEKRRVWEFINVQNASAQAEAIGRRQLADLCLAMGRPTVEATEDLLYAPFEATLGVKTDKTYGPKNMIRKYHAVGEPAKGPILPPRQAAQPPQSSAPANKPWQRRPAA
jgi:hypothetical protein